MSYDELLIEADRAGLVVKEAPLLSGDGRCKGRRIAIRKNIPTLRKKADTLAEEMGHYYTTVGRIVEQNCTENRKQERSARLWAYNKQIGLLGIVRAYKAHCHTVYEMAEYLDVSEEFLSDALECYRQIYGKAVSIGDYYIRFEPYLQVFEYFSV